MFLTSWVLGSAWHSRKCPQENTTQDQTNVWTEGPNAHSKFFLSKNTASSFCHKLDHLVASWTPSGQLGMVTQV